MKTLLGIALAVMALAVLASLYSSYQNHRVIEELRENPEGERAQKVMLLTLPSDKSIPVNYLQDDPFVYAAADFPWWREVDGPGGRVTLLIRGEQRSGHARAVRDDPERRANVFSRLRPSAPSWTGTMVEVRLE